MKGDKMEAFDRLLNLQHVDLVVKKRPDGTIYTYYEHAEVKDGGMLHGVYGEGRTFEQACWDYLNKISGKTLVFDAYKESRREVTVL